ncbi:hypothetical protein LP316_10150 [Thalassotalea sp. LPB0316]|uniref:hypothetical protein n=1 Tax=Thalassotalea sp. LPB0316 TaxID=2769490 RepID=UPI001867D81E|nr:hypothetical protein [Thalassotalea sp. LPB0316]QOL24698.1 hypothetical protein LP316_10150 [Thalassotalea sp. LPB0316]
MKFVQSRFQDYFSRCYEAICFLGWYLLAAIALEMFFSYDIGFAINATIAGLFTLSTLFYLKFTQSGGSQYLAFDNDKIIYKFQNVVTEINHSDYQGYKITKLLPHQVVIYNKVYGKTKFSYYAFSSEQRNQIFELLDKM